MCSNNTYTYPTVTLLRGMLWRSPTDGPYCGPLAYLKCSASVHYIFFVTSPPFRYLLANRLYDSLGPICMTYMTLWTLHYSTTYILLIPTSYLVDII